MKFEEFFVAEAAGVFSDFRELDLQRFGHRLRYDLINKWNSIGLEETLGEGERIARNERARKLVDQVIGKHFVPSLPIFLITVLQTIDAGPAEVQQNGFGHYYHYLIVLAFKQGKVNERELSELFNYVEQLAFLFFDKRVKAISDEEFRAFNAWFSINYTSVDLRPRQQLLCATKILSRTGSSYAFKYPYVYYYFVALHLSHDINEPQTRDRVRHMCRHVHVSEYSNILLFLSHHTRDSLVLDELLNIARILFSGISPIALDTDITQINALVSELPQLVYRKSDPMENRREQLERKDKQGDASDPLDKLDPNSEIAALGPPEQWVLMFKVVEILGQVARNSYGVLKKPVKVELLEECYSGPLRSLGWLFQELASDPEQLVQWMVKNLHEDKPTATDEQKKTFARRILFWILAYIADNQLTRISDAVSSEHLIEECQMVVKKDPSVAKRLIDISNKLSFPEAIPFAEIDDFARELKNNSLAFRVLQSFAFRHLHMFKTTDKDKQKLCESLKIEVRLQRGIDLQTKDTKLLTRK